MAEHIMALPIPPTTKQLEDRIKSDVQREAVGSNPYLPQSVILAMIIGFARRVYDFFKQLQLLAIQCFWDTATGQSLYRWAAIFGKTKLAATQSTGSILATGTSGSPILSGNQLQNSNGDLFETTSDATILDQNITVTLAYSAGIVTATALVPILVASNTPVTISGATPDGYNGIVTPTQTGAMTFTYPVTTSLGSASGTIKAAWSAASIPVISIGYGESVNQTYNSPLTFTLPVSGVNNSTNVDFNALTNGTDLETDPSLRTRFLYRVQNPVAMFNVSAITDIAKSVAGVTKVWVQSITPAVGQVTIYFIRGNDLNIIPNGAALTATKAAIVSIMPAQTSASDVIVSAPTAVPANFVFTALSPNTTTMQNAITANLKALFLDQTDVAVSLTQDAYRAAIQNTFDSTGASVVSFTITSPSGSIGGSTGQLPTLGTVSYP